MGRVTVRRPVVRVRDGQLSRRPDTLAAEEPMEIRVGGRALTVTMRTPGDDFDLAAGFLVSEGVVHAAEDVSGVRYCAGATADGGNTYNVVDVALAPHVAPPDASLERSFYTTSSCGLCGKASLDAVRTTAAWSVAEDPLRAGPDVLAALPDSLRRAQRVFDSTGGLHAAGLFTAGGELLCVREDVGRHNAVDKVVGYALRSGLLPLRETILMVSGRASFELVQKAALAGLAGIVAVGAPSTLAVSLARDRGMVLCGFVRDGGFNVYASAEGVSSAQGET